MFYSLETEISAWPGCCGRHWNIPGKVQAIFSCHSLILFSLILSVQCVKEGKGFVLIVCG